MAIPVNVVNCDGQNTVQLGAQAWDWITMMTVPLCKSSPGNVGWLEWTPPNGSASELDRSIVNPNNPAISLSSWRYVASTGNVNGGGSCVDAETASTTPPEPGCAQVQRQGRADPHFDMTCRTANN